MYVGRSIDRAREGKRPVLPYRISVEGESLPRRLRNAVCAAEDARFYLHRGFDLRQIADALDDYDRGKRLRGASTISQQVVKNLFLWEGRSWIRKGLEAYLTVLLEAVLPKERILEIYLDTAEWGDGVFGAEAAARYYFDKPAARLTPWEAARLAAVLPHPRAWHPNSGRAAVRGGVILGRMSSVPRED